MGLLEKGINRHITKVLPFPGEPSCISSPRPPSRASPRRRRRPCSDPGCPDRRPSCTWAPRGRRRRCAAGSGSGRCTVYPWEAAVTWQWIIPLVNIKFMDWMFSCSMINIAFFLSHSIVLVHLNEFLSIFQKVQHSHSRHQKAISEVPRINLKDKLRFNNYGH